MQLLKCNLSAAKFRDRARRSTVLAQREAERYGVGRGAFFVR